MPVTLEIEKEATVDIEVGVYDVTIDGDAIDFEAEVDSDGDIRIKLDERDFESVAIKYLRDRNTDDELKDMFGLEEG